MGELPLIAVVPRSNTPAGGIPPSRHFTHCGRVREAVNASFFFLCRNPHGRMHETRKYHKGREYSL
jgi:hypothetical protein